MLFAQLKDLDISFSSTAKEKGERERLPEM
jgi:hypothetical protein